jgi:hypothetical protein
MRSIIRIGTCLLVVGSLGAAQAKAQDNPNTELATETARIAAETALINAQSAQKNAEAALIKAKIDALGLPSFTGKTELASGAGVMEATILASAALIASGKAIAAAAPGPLGAKNGYLILAGDEAVNFAQLGTIRAQLDGLRAMMQNAGVPDPDNGGAPRFVPGMAIAAVSAIGGLVRAETSISGIEITSLSNRTLATAAGKALRPSYLASAPTIPPDEASGAGRLWADQTVLQRINTLSTMRQQAVDLRKPLGEKPTGADATKAAQLDSAIARYDTAFSKFLSPDDKGVVPAAEAARIERLSKNIGWILRVHLEKAGGSVVNTKNIATTFGVDPVKISGGLVASYVYTNAENGSVEKAGVVVCRTTLTSLRHIQEGGLRARNKTVKALPVTCGESLSPN